MRSFSRDKVLQNITKIVSKSRFVSHGCSPYYTQRNLLFYSTSLKSWKQRLPSSHRNPTFLLVVFVHRKYQITQAIPWPADNLYFSLLLYPNSWWSNNYSFLTTAYVGGTIRVVASNWRVISSTKQISSTQRTGIQWHCRCCTTLRFFGDCERSKQSIMRSHNQT